jgi:hypothetical protein
VRGGWAGLVAGFHEAARAVGLVQRGAAALSAVVVRATDGVLSWARLDRERQQPHFVSAPRRLPGHRRGFLTHDDRRICYEPSAQAARTNDARTHHCRCGSSASCARPLAVARSAVYRDPATFAFTIAYLAVREVTIGEE